MPAFWASTLGWGSLGLSWGGSYFLGVGVAKAMLVQQEARDSAKRPYPGDPGIQIIPTLGPKP